MPTWPRTSHRRELAGAACCALVATACAERNAAPDAGDGRTRAALAVAASVQATSANAVELRATYAAGAGSAELARRRVTLSDAAAQDVTLSLDLSACLHALAAPPCPVTLDVSLLRDTTTLDARRVGPLGVAPGRAVTVPEPVALYEVAAVRVGASGAPTVLAGGTLALIATATDRTGGSLAGRVVRWESSDPSVLRVDPASGIATGVSAGLAVARAWTGGRAGELPVTVLPVGPSSAVSGRLTVGATGAPVAGASLRFARADGLLAATVVSAADGTWRADLVPHGVYTVAVGAVGMRSTTIRRLAVDGAVSVPAIPMTLDDVTMGTVQLTLRNASTGRPLPVASTVTIVDGIVLGSQAADAVGGAAVSVPIGGAVTLPPIANTVTLRARAPGYGDALLAVAPDAGGPVAARMALAPDPRTADHLRVVLVWGATPRDLDAHLTGPLEAGGRFAVFHDSRGDSVRAPFARLDADEKQGYGPETITISRLLRAGVYRYAVNRFAGAGSIATSGARVDVYVDGLLTYTFTPPPGSGDWWNVFEIVDGRLSAVDTYGAPPALRRRLP